MRESRRECGRGIEGHLVNDKGELSKLWVMPMVYLLALESGDVGPGRSVSGPCHCLLAVLEVLPALRNVSLLAGGARAGQGINTWAFRLFVCFLWLQPALQKAFSCSSCQTR
jgi:hypothetical protein